VAAQLDAVFSDIGTDATKIGMLFSAEITEVVAKALQRWDAGPVVLDPVMVAKSGDRLLTEAAVESLRKHLIPLADLVTPNLPEAEALLSRGGDASATGASEGRDAPATAWAIEGRDGMERAAVELLGLGPKAVLLKGGHLTDAASSADVLAFRGGNGAVVTLWFDFPRVATVNTHGTGCTLSSAIAAHLARGDSLETAVERARSYTQGAIEAGAPYALGEGHGPVHHFHALWQEARP
jgi:hydroxymethylpyrimidine/phosphomethylpyrimidine kinase